MKFLHTFKNGTFVCVEPARQGSLLVMNATGTAVDEHGNLKVDVTDNYFLHECKTFMEHVEKCLRDQKILSKNHGRAFGFKKL